MNPSITVAWDLSRARFHFSGGPEPRSDFYVAVAVDGEMLLVAGDMAEEAHRKMRARRRTPAMLVSRKDEVFMKPEVGSGIRSYRTAVIVSGKEREVSIEIGGKEKESVGLVVAVDGMKVLQVRRIRWKFRGREKVEIEGRIQISWNLFGWLFPAKEESAGDVGQAVFVFMFEGGEEEGAVLGRKEEEFDGGCFGDGEWRERGKGRKKCLLKTSSSSSASSASSAGSSSVMDWSSPEEDELRGGGRGFSLVVHAWKS